MKKKKTPKRYFSDCEIKDCAKRYGKSYAHAVDLGWSVISFHGLAVLLCPSHRREDVELSNLKAVVKAGGAN